MSDQPVLRLEGVEKSYNLGRPNETRVLSGADLRIHAGEIVGLIAPSGAGKSTLLHIAGLLDTPDAGQVDLCGQAMARATDAGRSAARCRDLGFVYQFHHLLPEFSALENIVLPQLALGHGEGAARARAAALLDRVGLSQRAQHRPAQMSGGEQQRVAICRALANAPRMLLADEPTGNLDPDTADMVFDMLLDLVRASNMAALVATHNHALAARMDRVLVLSQGQIAPHCP
ncbi:MULTISPECIES: ABC transporter ATP-binding protein [unclassified Roseobacter]|jgi:lipoprotein-releasing system ATP-binding protein|uniref:ABC transporter ATP-binding protein n=1 Tax=unclassified Roseobacter TaxID=196798 RepID=UPI001D73FD46|nr:ATP-binding cassette domain-containing protein [Rhodobacterales bacterium HKCCA1058]MBF9024631.1 ATP-binding cassette domain-containing protein [Rhodobacterales bacterium HKCCD6035]